MGLFDRFGRRREEDTSSAGQAISYDQRLKDGRSIVEKMKAKKDAEGLIKVLKDGRLPVRTEVSEALGEIGVPAVEPLIQCLGDERGFVREGAAEALAIIGDKRAVRPLLQAFELGRSTVLREAIVKAFRRMEDAAAECLIQALRDEDKGIRRLAAEFLAEFLAEIADAKVVEPLIGALQDEDLFVREMAAYALGIAEDKRAVRPLIQALEDEDEFVRVGAATVTSWRTVSAIF